MKQCLSVFLALSLLPCLPLAVPAAQAEAPPDDLTQWMQNFQQSYPDIRKTVIKPIGPVSDWPTHYGGGWSCQYPPDWTLLSGDTYSFMVCDARRLACYDYAQVIQFNQLYSHDQLGQWVLSRVAGYPSFEVLGTFQKNIFPDLMLTPPDGIAQVWFIRWQHPQAGPMFTVMEVTILSYKNWAGYGEGLRDTTSFTFASRTAPEAEFTTLWKEVFSEMFPPIRYTIPDEESDRDGDGQPDSEDNHPDDPNDS